MPLSPAQRRLTAWFALWSMVLGTLLPAVAQAAWRGQDRADWIEICTTTGMVWVQAEGADHDEDAPGAASVGMSCPWCLTPHGGPGLPAADHSLWLPRIALAQHAPPFAHAAPAERAWRSAHPRGPPAQA